MSLKHVSNSGVHCTLQTNVREHHTYQFKINGTNFCQRCGLISSLSFFFFYKTTAIVCTFYLLSVQCSESCSPFASFTQQYNPFKSSLLYSFFVLHRSLKLTNATKKQILCGHFGFRYTSHTCIHWPFYMYLTTVLNYCCFTLHIVQSNKLLYLYR